MGPTDIVGTIGAVSTALSALVQIVRGANSHEAEQRLGEVLRLLSEVQIGAIANVNRIAELDGELRELKSREQIEGELEHVGDTLWRRAGVAWKGPYCPVCWGSTQKLVYLVHEYAEPEAVYWYCKIHVPGGLSAPKAELKRLGIR